MAPTKTKDPHEEVELLIKIDKHGMIKKVQEKDKTTGKFKNLKYGTGTVKKMTTGDSLIVSNPCKWRRFGGQWFCI